MYLPDIHKIWLATGENRVYLEPTMANRHGLIAGATGTGKTVTLKVLAESFSDMGVPVFLADIKGDLSGMVNMGVETKHILRSIDSMKIENFDIPPIPSDSGMFTASRVTPCARRFPKWVPTCSAACWI